MRIHQDWSTATFDLAPIAPLVGPFPSRDWLRTWWTHRGTGELVLADTGSSLVALLLEEGHLEFAGEADLTDYHSPLGTDEVSSLAAAIDELPANVTIRLDSLPTAAATNVSATLTSIGLHPITTQHSAAAVLTLPESFDAYLAALGKKDRHELRRKRRRFDNEVGPATVERRHGPEAVALFADLHRRSAGDKGLFMSAALEEFFGALHLEAGGLIDVLVDGSGLPAAAMFSFADATGFYLYNSAFEPDARHLSPGNVMLSYLIERAIEDQLEVFDFLKGSETYKFRLGAAARPLYLVEARTGR